MVHWWKLLVLIGLEQCHDFDMDISEPWQLWKILNEDSNTRKTNFFLVLQNNTLSLQKSIFLSLHIYLNSTPINPVLA